MFVLSILNYPHPRCTVIVSSDLTSLLSATSLSFPFNSISHPVTIKVDKGLKLAFLGGRSHIFVYQIFAHQILTHQTCFM
jgi:hypothetical protein